MSVFALSDTHLSFSSPKPMDVFGARWTGHENKILSAWNQTVGTDDAVIIGGDVSWAMSLDEALPDLRFIDRLNGRKILLRGNHDFWWSTRKKLDALSAENGLSSISFLHNNAYNAGTVTVCGSRGWFYEKKNAPEGSDYQKIVLREAGRLELSLSDGEKIRDGREIVVFLHFPPVFGDFICPELSEVMKDHGVKRCFFGHIHGASDLPGAFVYDGITFVNTAADYLDFTPLKLA